METSPQSFDVCVVCALPEEARAFLEILQQHCEDAFEEHVSSRYHYSSRFATIKNNKGELLNLHISWLPRYGPQEMTLHLSRVLEECQPRIAIMTGICAGDAQQVQLGDLVVAERTFTYDNGKFTLDEQGRSVHLHDTLTYQLDANILQFLGLFDDWKPLVTRLKRPSYPPGQHKRRKIACYIKAMASGSAVRADHPFEDLRAPVRGTVAIDMEGAAFGLVMSRHPLIRWLVVKGICDYADQNKNDAYHDYAAHASAIYALSFLRAYVTRERLPRPDEPPHLDRTRPSGVWNVPYRRNPYFTGRDELLDRLAQQLFPEPQAYQAAIRRTALTQPKAIKGLGGIGKTQIAVEYAYRSRELKRYTHTFWINAASEEALLTSFAELAELLPAFPEKGETDQRKLVSAIIRWLGKCQERWLLIFDNADEIALVRDYFPKLGNGSILLTTRAYAVGSLAAPVEVETMGFLEGTQLLLRRAQRLEYASEEEINQAGNIVIALDYFPLALDQAGAYIEETQSSFENYLDLYQTHRLALLAQRGTPATDYSYSVATTWLLSFQKVERANPAAAELLELCSFLAPDRIPEELFRDGAAYWPVSLQYAIADPLLFEQLIAELLKFSLVKRLVEEHALSIHRLVQAVQKDRMEREKQRQWVEKAIRAINEAFPDHPDNMVAWPQCLRYLNQAQTSYELLEHYGLAFVEAASLLNRTGLYLKAHALYAIAEPLYLRAITIYQQQLDAEHPDIATSFNNLAELYRAQGKYEQAEQLHQHALRICEQQLGTGHLDTASSLNNLAELYLDQGKYEEAEPLHQRALGIREQQLGAEHPDTAQSLNNLAALYYAKGKYEQAEPLYQRALTISEKTYGPGHLDVATNLNNLAELCRVQGRYEQGELLYKRACLIYEQQLGSDHPSTGQSLNNLAMLYLNQGKYEQAEPLYQRALAIDEKAFGPEHPNVATDLNNLAMLYRAQGRYEQVELLHQRALGIREQQLGSDHPHTAASLNNLAQLYLSQGKYEEAEALYQRALLIYEQQLGPEHPDTAASLNNLATLFYAQGKYEEAEALYQRALLIYEQQLGPEHPTTQMIRENYVTLIQMRGRKKKRRSRK